MTISTETKYAVKKGLKIIGFLILAWIMLNGCTINLYCGFSDSKLCVEYYLGDQGPFYQFTVPGHDQRGIGYLFFSLPYIVKTVFF